MRELPQQGEIPTVRVGVRGNPEPAHLPMLAGNPSYRSYAPPRSGWRANSCKRRGRGWPTIWRGRGEQHDHRSRQSRLS